MRPAFSVLEVTITALVLSIVGAIVVPRWTEFQQSSRIASASMALLADIRALQNYSARNSTSLLLTIDSGSSVLNIQPAIPTLVGDRNGNVNYARRYPGVVFTAAPFQGSNSARTNIRGELVNANTGQSLESSDVSLSYGGATANVDLLSGLNLSSQPGPGL